MTERRAAEEPRTWRPLDLIRVTVAYLETRSVDAPRLCAEKLLARALGCERIDLYTGFDKEVPSDALGRFRELVRRRGAREPIQHLIGQTEFWSLPIRCDARALVPRPETELLVRTTITLLQGRDAPLIADIGTGTGCIAFALARELKNARIVASDISADALALAAENLRLHEFDGRVSLIEGDLVAPFLEREWAGAFDIVLSNPPYVAAADISRLQPEVRDHDPHIALFGGADGLDVTRRLLAEVPPLLRSDGFLLLELGDGQADPVREGMGTSGWRVVQTIADGAGIERVIVAQRETDG